MKQIDNKKMWESTYLAASADDSALAVYILQGLQDQGYTIKGGEIVSIEPERSVGNPDEPLTEFEETLLKIVNSYKGKEMHTEGAKAWAKELLSIARKQVIDEAVNYMNTHIPIITTNIAICDERYTTILKEGCIEDFRKTLEKGGKDE